MYDMNTCCHCEVIDRDGNIYFHLNMHHQYCIAYLLVCTFIPSFFLSRDFGTIATNLTIPASPQFLHNLFVKFYWFD